MSACHKPMPLKPTRAAAAGAGVAPAWSPASWECVGDEGYGGDGAPRSPVSGLVLDGPEADGAPGEAEY